MAKPTQELHCKLRVERLLYPKYGFSPGDFVILSCTVTDTFEGEPYDSRITIKGKVFSADLGMTYHCRASLVTDEKWGYSYTIDFFQQDFDLSGKQERLDYLQTVMTPNQFLTLTSALDDPYEVIANGDIKKLSSIKGIGPVVATRIVNRFQENLLLAKVFGHLYQFGITVEQITSLLDKYTDADMLLDHIDHNPYLLIKEVRGIGWSRADAIAAKVGIKGDDPRRVAGYVVYFLNKRAEDGHTWCTPSDIWDALTYDLQIDNMDVLRTVLTDLHDEGTLYWNDDRSKIGLTDLYNLERDIAAELLRISNGPLIQCASLEDEIHKIEEDQGWAFTDEQISAVHMLAENNVAIVTGFGGTGKTSAVTAILKMLKGASFAQCALSGRAAARLGEVTGISGKTIHRLLGYEFGRFVYNKENPLPYNVIIVDEISMVGAMLFRDLIEAIPTGAKLIMLGDDGQLESIGLCNIFKDMLDSGVIPVARLTKIHRQAAKSAIITESIKVRNGIQLCDDGWVGEETRGQLQDLTLNVFSDSICTPFNILEQYKALLAQGVSKHRIQVVLPMKARGEACTQKINAEIQNIVNLKNKDTEVAIGNDGYTLRLDDRVICNKNMYKAKHPADYSDNEDDLICPVFNGDRGVITKIDRKSMIVMFDQWGPIQINRGEFSNIELGYALSCHKLQGSEADFVIIGFDMASRILLTKEWLYTAITRAKKKCIVTCLNKALVYCVGNTNIPYKRTFLRELLIEAWESTND